MNFNSKFWTIAGVIVPTLALIVTIFMFYASREKKTSLEVKKISDTELTRPLNVAQLSSTYLYDSIPVDHLWQTSYVIKNTGENALYGEGFENKNICGNFIKLHIRNTNKLLSIKITDTNADALLDNDSSLRFTQWRPSEYVELLLLSDGPKAPEIIINDRDIQNATISYVIYSPEEQLVEQRMMDRLPRSLDRALWWIAIIFDALLLLIMIYGIVDGIIQTVKKKSKASDLIPFIWVAVCLILSSLWMF